MNPMVKMVPNQSIRFNFSIKEESELLVGSLRKKRIRKKVNPAIITLSQKSQCQLALSTNPPPKKRGGRVYF
jgi:hypothetical protein